MAPKGLPPANKQAAILSWFHNSGVAHSIKDLEKALPSVASINSMQVKDYLQALSDESHIRVEKIGSVNWYWSFASDATKSKAAILTTAKGEHAQTSKLVEALRTNIEEAERARDEDGEMLPEHGSSRASLTAQHVELVKGVDALAKELAGYSESDPTELTRRLTSTHSAAERAVKETDDILIMESWLRTQLGGDREQMTAMMRDLYGDEYDAEEGCLREI